MTRDGTVGRSDATERSLPFHWDIDPARMIRPRFADSIRASSPSGLHQQAGHMTASDFCAARYIFSCQAGAIHIVMLMQSCNLIIVDISKIKEGSAWELNQITTLALMPKCLFIVSDDHLDGASELLDRYVGNDAAEVRIYTYSQTGKLADPGFQTRLQRLASAALAQAKT